MASTTTIIIIITTTSTFAPYDSLAQANCDHGRITPSTYNLLRSPRILHSESTRGSSRTLLVWLPSSAYQSLCSSVSPSVPIGGTSSPRTSNSRTYVHPSVAPYSQLQQQQQKHLENHSILHVFISFSKEIPFAFNHSQQLQRTIIIMIISTLWFPSPSM